MGQPKPIRRKTAVRVVLHERFSFGKPRYFLGGRGGGQLSRTMISALEPIFAEEQKTGFHKTRAMMGDAL